MLCRVQFVYSTLTMFSRCAFTFRKIFILFSMSLPYEVCVRSHFNQAPCSISEDYSWNKTIQSPEQFVLGYFQEICRKEGPLEVFPCSNDISSCEIYDTCCPDEELDILHISPNTQWLGCTADKHVAIVKCPESWENDTIREKCEVGHGDYTPDEPVSDLRTQVTYRNQFCARCHELVDHEPWLVNVTCHHFQFVYKARSVKDLLNLASKKADVCSMTMVPPDGVRVLPCPALEWFTAVGSCNTTGKWAPDDYDKDVEENCLTGPRGLLFRVKNHLDTYENLFCAICNGKPLEPSKHAVQYDSYGHVYSMEAFPNIPYIPEKVHVDSLKSPLSLLLGLTDRNMFLGMEKHLACSQGQFMGPTGICHNVTCSDGKLLSSSETCVTALTQIRGLVYKVDVTLVPNSNLTVSMLSKRPLTELATQITKQILERTHFFSYVDTLNIDIYFDLLRLNNHQAKIEYIRLRGSLTGSREVDRDDLEKILVHELLVDPWTLYKYSSKIIAVLKQKDKLFENRTGDRSVNNLSEQYIFLPKNWSEIFASLKRQNYTTVKFHKHYSPHSNVIQKSVIPESLQIELSPLLTCAYITFSPSEYEIRESDFGGTRLFVVGEYYNLRLTQLIFMTTENDTLHVCVDALQSAELHLKVKSATLWLQWFSRLVISLSIVCLFLTLAVYVLLPDLRTQPGLNLMGLCATLWFAQMTLLVASHHVVWGTWCRVVGMLLHGVWLSAFCWMVVCSVHMFRAFSAKTFHFRRSKSLTRSTARHAVLSFVCPAIIVGLVIVISSAQSHGKSIGYGGPLCYLSSQVLVGVAMVLPLSVAVLVNLVLFVLTLRRINEAFTLNPLLETKRDSLQHVQTCARLSLLTGITWVVSLLAEGFNFDWLRVISVVANGGQGVLLFVSYVTTRKVFTLLRARLTHAAEVTSQTELTDDKAMAKVASLSQLREKTV